MRLEDAEALARQLINHHLPGWTFGWDNAQRFFGRCYFKTKHISLSKPLTELNKEADIKDVILHEIAHGIAGWEAGHSYDWKRVANNLGCSANRCAGTHVALPKGKWLACCKGCGQFFRRVRPPKVTHWCTKCHVILTWVKVT